MALNRQVNDGRVGGSEQNNSLEDQPTGVFASRKKELEVVVINTVRQVIGPVLKPLICEVVKTEIESALENILTSTKRNSGNEMHPSELRSLQLQFSKKLSLPILTGMKIKGEGGTSIQVALVDGITGQGVNFGPEASAKVEIVVLGGDFNGDERHDWTLEEFNQKIVREREGNISLLTANVYLNLKEGIGYVDEISFTHNRKWMKRCQFRLGARVMDNLNGTRVREAMTECFFVEDRRSKLYKKHHPPSLLDEVWRLEKIGKDGAFHKRLSREKVCNMKDFLTLLFLDPTRLRTILGTGMSAKMWEVTVDHAQTCVIDKKLYLYCSTESQQKTGVVFNVVGQVMGLLKECQYVPIDKLSETEKVDAHNLVIPAFKHWDEVVSFDDEASLMDDSLHLSNVRFPSNSAVTESSGGSKILSSHKIGGFDYPQPIVPSPDIIPYFYSIGSASSMNEFGLPNVDNMDLRYDQSLNVLGQVPNSLICDTESFTQAFCEDACLQYFNADCTLQSQNSSLESQAYLHSALSGFLSTPPAAAVAIDKAPRRWTMISSMLRWFSIRRIVAKKNRVSEMQRYC